MSYTTTITSYGRNTASADSHNPYARAAAEKL